MPYKEADRLLSHWWLYTRWRDDRLGYGGVAPYCKQMKSSRQWDDTAKLADDYTNSATLRKIDRDVIPALEPYDRAAIAVEMRNRESARVWRTDGVYGDALEQADGIMRDFGLL